MATEITVPNLGESVTEATVVKWLKKEGESVKTDEPVVELETDKVSVEVPAPAAGTIAEIQAEEGSEVEVGAVLGSIDEAGEEAPKKTEKKAEKAEEKQDEEAPDAKDEKEESKEEKKEEPKEEAKEEKKEKPKREEKKPAAEAPQGLSPAVRRLIEENDLRPDAIPATGKDGRLTKADVLAYIEEHGKKKPSGKAAEDAQAEEKKPARTEERAAEPEAAERARPAQYPPRPEGPREERVRMTRLRKRVAERLKEAQNTAAMLTTFNEVDMTNLLAMRSVNKETFEKKHGVKLGFMSFFAKACVVALREFPAINAEVDGDEIVYKNYYDIGIAVGTEQGLVVPVVRDVDALSFADIERTITDYGKRAREGKLAMEELQGGTFTITNGGVYGSLMSTPILNPPQSGILGMHKTQQRPMVMGDGSIQARPMMYIALSYDHRIVDGREAVSFLVRVKQCVEEPERIMLDA